MKKYTLKTIKKTKCYKANIEAIRAIYPDHVEDFARELMIAFNTSSIVKIDKESLTSSFLWSKTKQGYSPWAILSDSIADWNRK